MRDFSLGYDLHGERLGLGVSLSEPPERFGVREWRKDGDCAETFYFPERTCVPILVQQKSKYVDSECGDEIYSACGHFLRVVQPPKKMQSLRPNYCPNCGARVVSE